MGGVALAVLFSLSRVVEYSLYPLAVVLQVTPVIAVAPLLLIYLPQDVAVLACAWIVAFFPILSNTMLGLQSVDRNLLELFALYGTRRPEPSRPFASRARALWILRRPAALPAFMAGLRIATGLSLIGAVVAEMAAGSAGAGSGLAYRMIESQYRLNIPAAFRRSGPAGGGRRHVVSADGGGLASGAAPLARERDGPRRLNSATFLSACHRTVMTS